MIFWMLFGNGHGKARGILRGNRPVAVVSFYHVHNKKFTLKMVVMTSCSLVHGCQRLEEHTAPSFGQNYMFTECLYNGTLHYQG